MPSFATYDCGGFGYHYTHVPGSHWGRGDGIHPKVGNQLSFEAKQVIVDGLNQCEKLEAWPGVLNILNAAPKETGGYRLLGLFSTRYRWWSRRRFLHAAEWGQEFNHRVFWSGRGRPSTRAILEYLF